MRRLLFVLSVIAMFAAGCAPANLPAATSAPAGLQIVDPWARAARLALAADGMATATPDAMQSSMSDTMSAGMGGVNSAVYLTIKNPSATADRLIKAQSEVAQATELHQTTEENGLMKMQPVEAVEVPAQGEAVLKPGGYHIMLVNLNRDLKVGDKVTITLTFEKAGPITVEADVREN